MASQEQTPPATGPTDAAKSAAEDQIREHQKDVDYDIKEYPVEVIVQKYCDGIDEELNELFVPDYQREMAWSEDHQSKFIESVLIGLPVPYLFVADVGNTDEEKAGRLEIVDGSQRVRTLAAFLQDELVLNNLPKLTSLKGFRFSDLPLSRQRRFKRRTLRMIELTEKADEEVRRDIFERINTGSVELQEMEKRRGIKQGPMLQLVEKCASDTLFHQLAPLTATQIKRRDREELVLRFFAYRDRYQDFGAKYANRPSRFLNAYLDEMNKEAADLTPRAIEFRKMLEFVAQHFPNGFAKAERHTSTPRIRFEAISVGVALALQAKPDLVPRVSPTVWLGSEEFKKLTTSDSSNSRPKIVGRIEFVRDRLTRAK